MRHVSRLALDRPFDLGMAFVLMQSGISIWLLHELTPMRLWSDALLALGALVAGACMGVGVLARPQPWASVVREAGFILGGFIYLAYTIAFTMPPTTAPNALALASGVVITLCFFARAVGTSRYRVAILTGLRLTLDDEEEGR